MPRILSGRHRHVTGRFLLVPSLAFGLYLGGRLHARVSPRVVLMAIHMVILVAGISLLVRRFVLN